MKESIHLLGISHDVRKPAGQLQATEEIQSRSAELPRDPARPFGSACSGDSDLTIWWFWMCIYVYMYIYIYIYIYIYVYIYAKYQHLSTTNSEFPSFIDKHDLCGSSCQRCETEPVKGILTRRSGHWAIKHEDHLPKPGGGICWIRHEGIRSPCLAGVE